MNDSLAHGIVQVLALAALLAGLYLVAGLAWALVVGGGAGLLVSVLAELSKPRPERPAAHAVKAGE